MLSRYLTLTPLLFLVACSGEKFDPSNTISDFYASNFCAQGSGYYKYEKECEGKSVEFDVFVRESEGGGEYLISFNDPQGFDHSMTNKIAANIKSYKKLYTGDKIKLKGVFGGTSFSGKAEFDGTSLGPAELSDLEKDRRATTIRNRELDQEEKRISSAYYHCADKAMAKLPGTECDKPLDAGGRGRFIDGEIKIESVCFWGKKTVVIECDGGKFGSSATLTLLEVK